MGSLSIWHWLIVGAVVLLVFGGRNKISDMMGDVARGIKAFKKGMSDDETAENSAKTDAAVGRIREQSLACALALVAAHLHLDLIGGCG